ncbi:cytochrome c biogenesis protein ResB (plasmid) [Cytobacillus firmus]|jgi:cytochrome c biogenesis protein|uniref:Cytochrome C biogenesis protein n=1 Tax=Cytobacillus oceanisediminis 2691 TaxID=1196031 RepID=A0A169G2Z3_9BACI|nr:MULTISPECIES: cytochrome c biogenesis protein ResB [Cytobacillus]AND42981.1 cytochrome C biogenesis protein [Cytobacillus oceanisediminis 2691]MCM3244643.1 cytochrome c biogenesis protein ResB [Cytobacillus oceanisediminis]USK41774.1 cytochrome c biogenesis protein ResB [Cytobacillus firmus]USK47501.1 cytochrome c biogenesis protein ResB [Cytobacillus oceanisediminis]
MEHVKCVCGHSIPYGTLLCESCGRNIGNSKNEVSEKLLDMRYDGSARRSQTYKKSLIDKIWNFFSSVKVGVWIIVLLLIASAIGTIFPQEIYIPQTVVPKDFYKDEYGFLGQLYYELGFHNLYGSWWYFLLIAALGISLVIASLDRFIPLYRALNKQGITRHKSFLSRQRLFSETKVEEKLDEQLDLIISNLERKRYQVREENGHFLAEKSRFSRWGPYVNHVGLIIFLIGGMLRFVPGMYVDEMLWIRDGETSVIPGTDGKYYLTSDKFIMDTYQKDQEDEVFANTLSRVGDGNVVKNFQTNVILYERKGEIVHGAEPELEKIKDEQIRVNYPLKHDSYALYQTSYKLNELNKFNFNLVDKETEESFGKIKVDLLEPKKEYDLGNGYKVEIVTYLPNFYFNSEGVPDTKNRVPDNPAFVFNMISPEKPEGERSFVAIKQTFDPDEDNQFKMKFEGVETKNLSALTVRKDNTLWFLGVGGAIFMIGVIQGMYWNHRRIWIRRDGDNVLIAGHTNKNWYGIQNEVNRILKETSIQELTDQTNEKS